MRKITEKMAGDIEAKIEWEGLDYYLTEYAWDDLEGTEAEEALRRYLDSRNELLGILADHGIDVG